MTLALLACNGNDAPKPWPNSTTPSAPLISTLSPVDGATGVALNVRPSAVFNMAMTPLSGTTFTLVQGTTQVAGSVTNSADGLTATFAPASPLAPSSVFTATITTGAMSSAGANIAANRSWSFTTTTAAIPPVVTSTSPAANATAVAINSPIVVNFSKVMDPSTITSSTFTLSQGGTVLPGSVVNGPGNSATLTPANPLTPGTVYRAALTISVKDLQGNPLAAAVAWTFTTAVAVDTTPPTVSATLPAANATGVSVNANLTATFSKPIAAATINPATFTLMQGTTPVLGTVAYAATTSTATFTPTTPLAINTLYKATLTTSIKDLAGNALATAFTWSFTTALTVDTTPPTVNSTIPAANSTGVSANTAIVATFSKAMNPLTITATTFTVMQGTTPVLGALAFGSGGTTATFTPTSSLVANTVYTVALTTAVKDLAGNGLASAFTWTFTTAPVDTTRPVVVSTNPADLATGVALNTRIAATFSKALDPATITATTFTVMQGTTPVLGTVVYGPGISATFTPTSPLAGNSLFTATLTTGVKDLAGNALANAKVWSFTTGTAIAKGPAVVNLGTAGNYAILAKSQITTVPDSKVTGDIGLSPAAASYIQGFSLTADATNVFATSTQIVGKVFASDYAVPTPTNLTTAVGDMQTAYTDAAGRPTPDFLELGTGNIGGLTLAPGLYKWTSTVTIPTDVTISGGANDVWIFQTSGDLTMSNAKTITLAGGAQAKNIFWQVAGQVTIGTGAHFEGILLCQTQVTLQTSATMNGRILAQTMVALQKATVTVPAP